LYLYSLCTRFFIAFIVLYLRLVFYQSSLSPISTQS
jgi:hypothetical protein